MKRRLFLGILLAPLMPWKKPTISWQSMWWTVPGATARLYWDPKLLRHAEAYGMSRQRMRTIRESRLTP